MLDWQKSNFKFWGWGKEGGLAFKMIISCTKDMGVRNVGNFVYKIRCKCMSKVRNLELKLV